MSTNQTQHLHLSRWEPDDEILRADFNADNEKIDAALAALAGAYTPDNRPYVVGTFNGKAKVELGFTPAAVLVLSCYGQVYYFADRNFYNGGLALPDHPATTSDGRTGVITIVEGGFQPGQSSSSSTFILSNTCYYIAFR